ncbi:DUF6402 family protein [Paraburkholderia sp.]|uniref:DUF6402 family protein n=1 Tax=Paraburkholderia sp. TaxID=1926495 RepID=UPI00286F7392|nr:DUF6402 family protein [Paraburkholderia sp.]
MADEFPYYKISANASRWRKMKGARVVRVASLSMDKAPPSLPADQKPPSTKPPKADPYAKMVTDISGGLARLKKWLDTPDPSKVVPEARERVETVPPFDIQEIPGAMRREGMPIGAKLMERWFAGRLNYSPTDSDEKALINQDGEPHPETMFEGNMVTLKWILGFERARVKYDYLVSQAIRTPNALSKLKEMLRFYAEPIDIFPEKICDGNLMRLHKLFQFQFAGVDGKLSEKLLAQMNPNAERFGVPDDLSSALGSFNFYAAIGHARLFRKFDKKSISFESERYAEVTGVWVYVKDNYTFADLPGSPLQYLEHWGASGVIVMPVDAIASVVDHIPHLDSPIPHLDVAVTTGKVSVKSEVYYPVRNKDFRDWAIKHQRGGDFVVLTKPRYVPVYPPITIVL